MNQDHIKEIKFYDWIAILTLTSLFLSFFFGFLQAISLFYTAFFVFIILIILMNVFMMILASSRGYASYILFLMPFLGAYIFYLATARDDLKKGTVSIPKRNTFRKRLFKSPFNE